MRKYRVVQVGLGFYVEYSDSYNNWVRWSEHPDFVSAKRQAELWLATDKERPPKAITVWESE